MPGRIEVTFEPRVKQGAGVRLFGGAAFPATGIACVWHSMLKPPRKYG